MTKGNALIVYHSYGGNTQALAEEIEYNLKELGYSVKMLRTKELNRNKNYEELFNYDVLLLGSNTWGDGEMPEPMCKVIREIEKEDNVGRLKNKVTGVFGTGETGYANYCESVNILRDVMYPISDLAVTLKVEQLYSRNDLNRISKFAELVNNRHALLKGEIDINEKTS